MLELILTRHGETENNRNAVYCGWNDVTLNDKGIKEANNLKDKLSEEKIDVNQYRSILQAIFTENNNILSSLDSPNRSNLHRMIRIYDFLEYGQKKTP